MFLGIVVAAALFAGDVYANAFFISIVTFISLYYVLYDCRHLIGAWHLLVYSYFLTN